MHTPMRFTLIKNTIPSHYNCYILDYVQLLNKLLIMLFVMIKYII